MKARAESSTMTLRRDLSAQLPPKHSCCGTSEYGDGLGIRPTVLPDCSTSAAAESSTNRSRSGRRDDTTLPPFPIAERALFVASPSSANIQRSRPPAPPVLHPCDTERDLIHLLEMGGWRAGDNWHGSCRAVPSQRLRAVSTSPHQIHRHARVSRRWDECWLGNDGRWTAARPTGGSQQGALGGRGWVGRGHGWGRGWRGEGGARCGPVPALACLQSAHCRGCRHLRVQLVVPCLPGGRLRRLRRLRRRRRLPELTACLLRRQGDLLLRPARTRARGAPQPAGQLAARGTRRRCGWAGRALCRSGWRFHLCTRDRKPVVLDGPVPCAGTKGVLGMNYGVVISTYHHQHIP